MGIGKRIQKNAKLLMIFAFIAWGIIGVCVLTVISTAARTVSYFGSAVNGTTVIYILLVLAIIAFGYYLIYFVYLLILGFGRKVENTDLIVKKIGAEELRDQPGQPARTVTNITKPVDSVGQNFSETKNRMPQKLVSLSYSSPVKTNDMKQSEDKRNDLKIDVQQESRICTKCGAPVKDGMQFCFKCGTPL